MIRPATLDDVPTLVSLGAMMAAESPRFRLLRYSPEKVRVLVENVLRGDSGFLWVAEAGGEITGLMLGVAVPHWCSDDLVVSELALYMVPKHRGSTSALRLIRRFMAWAEDRGAVLTQAGVSTGLSTEMAARLYEAAGMRRFGVLLEA